MSLTSDITIQYVGSDGQGVGSDPAGNVYFVEGAFPGDEVRVRSLKPDKRYKDAEIVQIIRQSEDRREPACPYVGDCGGCDWMSWSYEKQIQSKHSTLKHVLERGSLIPLDFKRFVPAEKTLGYRRRIQVRQKGDSLGFYKKNSHSIVDIAECKVSDPLINESLKKIRLEGPSLSERKLELTVTDRESVLVEENLPHSASGFCQVHPEQNQKLGEMILSLLKECEAREVLELFCGDGNFSQVYAGSVEKILGIDSNEAAVRVARERNLKNASFECDFVQEELMRKLRRSSRGGYDTLLLDPPRRGMGKCLSEFLDPNVQNVLYVSCRPLSFVQDAQYLKNFTLQTVQGIDMFPQTHHIEFLAWFSRS